MMALIGETKRNHAKEHAKNRPRRDRKTGIVVRRQPQALGKREREEKSSTSLKDPLNDNW